MFIKNQKELKKYLQTKTDIFSQKKTAMINPKLTKQIEKTLKTITEPTFHAKNTMFYDTTTNSFLLFEHLILTTKGIILLNFVSKPKTHIVENELWWQSKVDSVLSPCLIHQTSVMAKRLESVITAEIQRIIPVIPIVVSNKPFTEAPNLVTLKEVSPYISNIINKYPTILPIQSIAELKTFFINWQEKTCKEFTELYAPSLYHNYSFLSPVITLNEFKQSILFDINNFLYEFAPESVIFADIQLPKHEIPPIEFLVVSYKGILILNTLEGYAQYQGELDSPTWTKLIQSDEHDSYSVGIVNPTQLSILQLQLLSQLFNKADLPETFRVICQTPIICNVKHKSIIEDKNLEHHLDRFFANAEDVFDDADIAHVVKHLNQINKKNIAS